MTNELIQPFFVPAAHQADGLKAIESQLFDTDTNRGCVILPTGSGKSYLQALALNSYQNKRQGVSRIHAIVAPRIQLALQHLNSFRDYQKDNSLTQYRPFALHSGGTGDDGGDASDYMIHDVAMRNINSGTSIDSIIQEFTFAQNLKVDLVVFATYHSLDRLFSAVEILNAELDYNVAGLGQFDECQYLVSQGFGTYLTTTPFDKNIFYTATRKTTADSQNGLGMDNIAKWGEIVFLKTPVEMYNAGIILRPRLHILGVHGGDDELDVDEGIVIETMKVHMSEAHESLPTKLVVNTRGTDYIEHIWAGKHFKAALPDVDIFKISSATGAWYYNAATGEEESLSREDWLAKIKLVSNCIVLHYDIISEGVDVSGLTGTLMMRNSGMAKSIQMIGRVLRLCDVDRENLKNGLINVNNPFGWIKPTGLVTVPIVFNNGVMDSDDAEYVRSLVNDLRSAGFDPSENVIIHEPRGTVDDDDIPPITGDDNEKKMKNCFDSIFELVEDVLREDNITVFASTKSHFLDPDDF